MFEGLTGRLGDIFDRLTRRGALNEEDVSAALREVRIALLEADVALPVVKQFIAGVKEKAVGAGSPAVGHARPDGRQDRPRPSGRDAGRRSEGINLRRRPGRRS